MTFAELRRRIDRHSIPVTECGCWIWTSSTYRFGHGQIVINYKHYAAHRVSWMAYRGSIPDGMHVLHRCDVPQCVNPEHLYLGKDKENCADRIRAGTQPIPPRMVGENHPNSKITAQIAREIRAATGPGREIAERYGVSVPLVSAIKNGRLWGHA